MGGIREREVAQGPGGGAGAHVRVGSGGEEGRHAGTVDPVKPHFGRGNKAAVVKRTGGRGVGGGGISFVLSLGRGMRRREFITFSGHGGTWPFGEAQKTDG